MLIISDIVRIAQVLHKSTPDQVHSFLTSFFAAATFSDLCADRFSSHVMETALGHY